MECPPLLPNKGQQTTQGKQMSGAMQRGLLVRPWDTKMSGLLPRSSVVVTWKAGCGESRTSGLEWGKDREVLPITTGEVVNTSLLPGTAHSRGRSARSLSIRLHAIKWPAAMGQAMELRRHDRLGPSTEVETGNTSAEC